MSTSEDLCCCCSALPAPFVTRSYIKKRNSLCGLVRSGDDCDGVVVKSMSNLLAGAPSNGLRLDKGGNRIGRRCWWSFGEKHCAFSCFSGSTAGLTSSAAVGRAPFHMVVLLQDPRCISCRTRSSRETEQEQDINCFFFLGVVHIIYKLLY